MVNQPLTAEFYNFFQLLSHPSFNRILCYNEAGGPNPFQVFGISQLKRIDSPLDKGIASRLVASDRGSGQYLRVFVPVAGEDKFRAVWVLSRIELTAKDANVDFVVKTLNILVNGLKDEYREQRVMDLLVGAWIRGARVLSATNQIDADVTQLRGMHLTLNEMKLQKLFHNVVLES